MALNRLPALWAVLLTVGLHALLWLFWNTWHPAPMALPASAPLVLQVLASAQPQALPPEPIPAPRSLSPPRPQTLPAQLTASSLHPPASMAAPQPPSAQEWAFAARYTLKNSKAYRHSWGQQVRSMMGTATEGPDQGAVRFRIEIAPNGLLQRLETLWSTSVVAERLARQAIENLPALPPTPTGAVLVFEKTIVFSAFASDGPPSYKDDCQPDPPAFRNPFAWDGRGQATPAVPMAAAAPEPQALADCLRQLPQDSIEAESARDQRLLEQWGSSRLAR